MTLRNGENDFSLNEGNEFLLYEKTTPINMSVPEAFFRSELVLLIDCHLHEGDFTVQLKDERGLDVFKLSFDEKVEEIKLESTVIVETITTATKISSGEPFILKIDFDHNKYVFKVVDNYDGETELQIPKGIFDWSNIQLSLTGHVDLHVFGFVVPGDEKISVLSKYNVLNLFLDYIHTMPVNHNQVYVCANETHDFTNILMYSKSFHVRCEAENGKFESVSTWPLCGRCEFKFIQY